LGLLPCILNIIVQSSRLNATPGRRKCARCECVLGTSGWCVTAYRQRHRGEPFAFPRTLMSSRESYAGSLDRVRMGALAFQDERVRRRLNKATHLPIMCAIVGALCKHWFLCSPAVVRDRCVFLSFSCRLHLRAACGVQADIVPAYRHCAAHTC
jgi:hypothetical protein